MPDSVETYPCQTRLNILHPPLEIDDVKALFDAENAGIIPIGN